MYIYVTLRTILSSVYLFRVDWTNHGTARETGIAVLRVDKGTLLGGMYESCSTSIYPSHLMQILDSSDNVAMSSYAYLCYASTTKHQIIVGK